MESILDNKLYEAFATASEYVYIYVSDFRTDLARWSKNAVEYFGLPGEYVKDSANMWQSRVHPDDKKKYMEDIGEVFEGGKSKHDCRYRVKNKYNEYVWVECRGSVITDQEDQPVLFAGILTRIDSYSKYDALTGLMKLDEFFQCELGMEQGALLLICIDEFRKIVSSHGYEYGDKVLVEFSKRLISLGEDKYSIYRFSGDEFMLVCPEMKLKGAKQLFQKISEELAVFDENHKHQLRLGVSGGVTFYPEEGREKEGLINNLEHSLEYAKKNCRGGIVVFNQEIADMQKRAQLLCEDLKNSIRSGFKGFELYFQPLYEKTTNNIGGCEALLRWKGDHIKDSCPSEFIKVLEDHGDIRDVGYWVMEQALWYQKKWQMFYPDFHLSFNVSYQQFMDENFVDILFQKVREIDADPQKIIIELTESCQVQEPESLAIAFRRLREYGFTIALDDFGTAYSSMEMLKYLPVNYIKIEHSFVKDLANEGHEIDYIIIESLLSLCKKLNCMSIVEGVENSSVKNMIEKMDVTYLQGYYFSRPVPEEEFRKMLIEAYKA
ncbi:bifunctional diguanylate cyclase/phosphodiesterase [[Clostridium] polysaccharolyticum]|uniref:Diguanylate cyclase (GGDEF) domain-containing protein n=1 Tax=[Clostridium] polysaccharolyticum TaxID=29364 RepID=A0A1H9ZD94_9FIRM|nr:GGDEF and EAL domain-containing protein [[Clostridium] polysaccharolyticum]SES79306.1 diguanylate cyclase (GGDEF) domain-containing protein [[Clostridium] polysaccharolyticum]